MRIRWSSIRGTLSTGITDSETEIESAILADLPPVVAPDVLAVFLDPAGLTGAPEILHVTDHAEAATTATVLRGQEQVVGGAPARAHLSGVTLVHGPTPEDFAAGASVGTFTTLPAAISSGTFDGAGVGETLVAAEQTDPDDDGFYISDGAVYVKTFALPVNGPLFSTAAAPWWTASILTGGFVWAKINDFWSPVGAAYPFYQASNPTYWVTAPPVTLPEAVDRLAAAVSNSGVTPIP